MIKLGKSASNSRGILDMCVGIGVYNNSIIKYAHCM